MIKRLFYFTFIFLIQNIILTANDGGFYASGNTLIPLSETAIELRKEYLNLTFESTSTLRVDIQFEFYNPGDKTELIVGFVTPPAGGVLTQEELSHPHITDFQVLFENRLRDFKVQRLDSTGFSDISKEVHGKDYIYYFKLVFKPGENIIRHSYKYKGGFSTDGIGSFNYRLTTGNSWANGQIDEFYLNINFGENKYANIPIFLEKNRVIDWHNFGISEMKPNVHNHKKTKAYFKSGGISTEIMNFKPDYDLTIDLIGFYPEDIHYFKACWGRCRETISLDELRIMKNALFAIKGYEFKSKDLFDYFSKFAWYFPDPNVKNDIDLLSARDKKIFDEILSEINKRNLE